MGGHIRLDFNPNKAGHHEVLQMVLGQCVSSTRPMHRKIRRYDLAVDIPISRQDAFLVKDSRACSHKGINDKSEIDKGQKDNIKFIIVSENTTKSFETSKKPFHLIALFV